MATFFQVLERFKWWFYENGGMHVFNELQTFARRNDGAGQVVLGTFDEYGDAILSAPGTLDVSSAVPEFVCRPQALGYKAPAGLRGTDPPTNFVA